MRRLITAAFALIALASAPFARAAELLDAAPRTAVISAFLPELTELAAATTNKKTYEAVGVVFVTGTLEGKPVVLFLSGVSMVNAAMTTQVLLDRFNVKRIVFSGIAGGVDPALDIGDVVVADKWGQYLESHFARETAGRFEPPTQHIDDAPTANFGMMFPQSVAVARGMAPPEHHFWFPVDPAMFAVAQSMPAVPLKRCIATQCLVKAPRLVVGGNGVSGPTFVDNAAFREYAFKTFDAKVLDMETAAVAHVAYANNKTPFIAFRSLSDLAGGGEGANQARTFFQLASDNSAAVVRAFLKALPQ
jgi:adenosylhomocysteine nucleosidase